MPHQNNGPASTSFQVTLSSGWRELSTWAAFTLITAALGAGPLMAIMWLPDLHGLFALGVLLGGVALGLLLAAIVVALCVVLPRHVEWLRHTTLHAQTVTVSRAGFHSRATGEVAWQEVAHFGEAIGDEGLRLGCWDLELHTGRRWRVGAALESTGGLPGLVAAFDAQLTLRA